MRPVSTKVASIRCANAYPMVLLPEPDGPSMATASGPSPSSRRGPRSRGGPGAWPTSRRTSVAVSGRHSPSRRPRMVSGPSRTRTSRMTRSPTAATRRRTSRLRPSPRRTRSQWPASPGSRITSRGGAAGRAVSRRAGPSSSWTPSSSAPARPAVGRAPAAPRTRAPWRTGDAAADSPTPRRW